MIYLSSFLFSDKTVRNPSISEDILYEIKKIQQEQVLEDGYIYEHIRRGMPKGQREHLKNSYKMKKDLECLVFAQEKYSNGETA